MRLDNVQDIYPLAPMQEGILFHSLYDPGAGEYFRQLSCRLEGELDVASFQEAWQEAIDRNPILRTGFLSEGVDEPVQVVYRRVDLPLETVDWRQLPPREQEELWQDHLTLDRQRGFDLAVPPLLRLGLFRTADRCHLFVWSYHHLILDGWSIALLLGDVFAHYRARRAGVPTPAPHRRPYRDYVGWLQQRDLAAAEAFWRRALAGFIAPTPLGGEAGSAAGDGEESYREERAELPAETTTALQALARHHRLTLNTLLQGAWGLLLARYSGEGDVVFGSTVAGRPTDLPGFEEMMGLFINTLPMRLQVEQDEPAVERLRRLQQWQAEARQYEYCSLAQVQGWSEVPRGTPLFESLVAFENYPVGDSLPAEPAAELTALEVRYPDTTNYPLTLIAAPGPRLAFTLLYETRLFATADVRRRLGHLTTLLAGIAADPARRLSDLPLLSAEERRQLLPDRAAARTYPQDRCLHEIFARAAAATPDTVAVSCGDGNVSYAELDRRVNRLAHRLQELGVSPEVRVALCLDRSPDMVVGLLGILKAGGAYVPIEPDYPQERQALLLQDAGVAAVVTSERLLARLPAGPLPAVCLDRDAAEIAAQSPEEPVSSALSGSLAYVIYTSGSTGTPKGVPVTHANVARLFAATQHWFRFDRSDVWTLFHSLAFDFSVWEAWGALLHGGRLVVVPHLVSRSPDLLLDLVLDQGVTVLNQTPTAFQGLLEAARTATEPEELPLHWIVFGGEALAPSLLAPWFDRHDDRRPRLVNMYGITETTVHVTYRPLAAADAAPDAGSPIGLPIPDLQVYVLDAAFEPSPLGVAGELHVGGDGLARGYLGRPDLTAERFVPDPFGVRPGARLYRTGDLGCLRPDGGLEYLGRGDHQVKVRGFRIEPGEIEAALRQHPGVLQAVVIAREDRPGEKRLVAYLVPAPESAPAADELRRHLRDRLPEHMVPTAFVKIASLPLTAHGKLDRRSLPAPAKDRPELEDDFVAPRTPVERILAEVWAEVLGVDEVGVRDNFFALGGDSIRSLQARSRAAQRGLDFSLQQLFQYPTISSLAAAAVPLQSAAVPAAVVPPFGLVSSEDRAKLPAGLEDAYPLTRLQAGMVFHSQLDPGAAVYHDVFSYRLHADLEIEALSGAGRRLAARHPVLRTSFDLVSFGELLQLVHRSVEIPLVVSDLRHLSATAREDALGAWLKAERARRFEWNQPPLLRFQVHRLGGDEWQFTLSFHHAVLDGWSVASLLTELFHLYLDLLGREVGPLPPAPAAAFRDFVAAEREALRWEEAERFWLAKVDRPATTALPRWSAPAPRESAGQSRSRRAVVPLVPGISEGLHRLARQMGVPVKSVLLAAHLRTLALLVGEADVTTGLVSHARPEGADGERVLGLFLNTLPLRLRLAGGTWKDLVQETFAAEREMLPFLRYPSAELLRRAAGRSPFEVVFNFVHFHVYEAVQRFDEVRVVGGETYEETNFPLTVSFGLGIPSTEVELALIYHADRLPPAQAEAIGGCYARVLAAMAGDPEARYELTPLLPPEDLRRLAEWNRTSVESPSGFARESCLHELVARQVALSPDRIAATCGDQQLTYGELDARADRLARRLAGLGVGLETPVALCLERSLEMAVAILAVLKAGGAWVPLDPVHPRERLALMLGDLRARVVLTVERLGRALPEVGLRVVCLDDGAAQVDPEHLGEPGHGATVDSLAYVIYTSGSTGQPKGVMVSHRAIANRLLWMQRQLPLDGSDRVLLKTQYTFDASIWELFVPLLAGAQVVMARPEGHRDPGYLVHEIEHRAVTVLQLVPSLLPALLEEPGSVHLPSLRRLFCGGEALPLDLAERAMARLGVEVHNLYGPTETAIDASWWACERGGSGIAPIGRALANLRLHLLDTWGQPAPIGTPGELYVGGVGLARGYLARPDLTAERFVPDLWSGEPGARLYRTGDLARRRADGVLEYLGRIDQQVKLRGFRIEPGEIEALLRAHPAVQQATVVVREDRPGDRRLVGYVVPRSGSLQDGPAGPSVPEEELQEYLAQRLPDFMLPSAVVVLDRLPLNASGKLDRTALPAPEWQRQSGAAFVPPRTPVEATLAAIWAEILGLAEVGVHDDFFALGGHSLLALRVIARIRKAFALELPLVRLFEEPTVARLAVTVVELLMEKIEELPEEEVEQLLASFEVGQGDAGQEAAERGRI